MDRLREVDAHLGGNNTRVSVWERGDETPKERYMKALTTVLEKSPDWFYTDHDKPDETPDLAADHDDDEPAWVVRVEDQLDLIQAIVERLAGDEIVAGVQRERQRGSRRGASGGPDHP